MSAEIPRGSFHEAVDCFRRELILAALRTHSGNRLRAARELKISRSYLHRLLKKLDISSEESGVAVKGEPGDEVGPEEEGGPGEEPDDEEESMASGGRF